MTCNYKIPQRTYFPLYFFRGGVLYELRRLITSTLQLCSQEYFLENLECMQVYNNLASSFDSLSLLTVAWNHIRDYVSHSLQVDFLQDF